MPTVCGVAIPSASDVWRWHSAGAELCGFNAVGAEDGWQQLKESGVFLVVVHCWCSLLVAHIFSMFCLRCLRKRCSLSACVANVGEREMAWRRHRGRVGGGAEAGRERRRVSFGSLSPHRCRRCGLGFSFDLLCFLPLRRAWMWRAFVCFVFVVPCCVLFNVFLRVIRLLGEEEGGAKYVALLLRGGSCDARVWESGGSLRWASQELKKGQEQEGAPEVRNDAGRSGGAPRDFLWGLRPPRSGRCASARGGQPCLRCSLFGALVCPCSRSEQRGPRSFFFCFVWCLCGVGPSRRCTCLSLTLSPPREHRR
ncbi:hypothetical protein TraAM80_10002 [Trypanosoma rangeli]|uniref:Uncharacterized protein n=1 Tax=Trypanosoma rangeli TaxID=5698 RepID=A0A3R7JVH9_TRYRA|nr:uncharacterized protein TraAM80_10002 [Trypanosoma rangeli]RNE96096.1 hypothetical protein TraAM80_10002 [Trypanosoma rangeli]|eukprot:RNE96096.1 hypothetical protein TraAM80_10002 [Trypanosoma rangeli]